MPFPAAGPVDHLPHVTAPSLSLPAGTLAAARQQLRSWRLLHLAVAIALVALAAVASQLLNAGGRVGVDPALPLLLAVVVAGALGGRRIGLLAALAAVGYGVIVYARPPWTALDGNGLRVLLFAVGAPAMGALAGTLRDRLHDLSGGTGSAGATFQRLRDFSEALAESRAEALPGVIVSRGAAMAAADMAALTIADRRTGQQVVRAVHGSSRDAIGVEILPGVGLAGQALRDQRTVVVGRAAPASADLLADLRSRLVAVLDDVPVGPSSKAPPVAPAIAVPLRHAGAIVGTLTLGRTDPSRPFSASERRAVELVAPVAGLAIANGLLRGQLREASLRDPLTGLYNRSYLDAALEQLLALRRRTPADRRPPLSLVLFAVDGLTELGQRHGQAAVDQALRAMAAQLRQRFRESDTIARLDTDGFLVVMNGAHLEHVSAVASEIRQKVRQMVLVDEHATPLSLSVSAGCATFHDDPVNGAEAVRTARAALDTARWSGDGSVVAI